MTRKIKKRTRPATETVEPVVPASKLASSLRDATKRAELEQQRRAVRRVVHERVQIVSGEPEFLSGLTLDVYRQGDGDKYGIFAQLRITSEYDALHYGDIDHGTVRDYRCNGEGEVILTIVSNFEVQGLLGMLARLSRGYERLTRKHGDEIKTDVEYHNHFDFCDYFDTKLQRRVFYRDE